MVDVGVGLVAAVEHAGLICRPRRRVKSANKKGRRSAERRLSRQWPLARQRDLAGRRARLPAPRHGTRHRLSPRRLSPRTGFPQNAAARCFAGTPQSRFELSTLRADRSLCRPTGAPGPPGAVCETARGHPHSLRIQDRIRNAPFGERDSEFLYLI